MGTSSSNDDGFLLALVPTDPHTRCPRGSTSGSTERRRRGLARHAALSAAGVKTGEIEDFRPDEDYVTFRCWDPDDTEIEIFWEP